jgi:GTP pyrophosphokinase
VRTYIRAEERRRSIKLGKDLVERAFHKKDMSFARFTKSGEAERLAAHFKVQNAEELFASVGYGRISAEDVLEVALQDEKSADAIKPGFIERTVRKVTGASSAGGIRIDDVDDVLVRFAQCCNPLPGDAITGWITRGRGVTVHRRGCPKAMELDPERRIDVAWSDAIKISRPVALKVTTADRPGILANVSAAFTEAGVNIQEANCRVGPDGQAVNLFQFLVDDAGRLQTLMRRIQGVDGVYSVERA